MKLGILISALILLVLAVAGYFLYRRLPDSPTAATAPEQLQKATLPPKLPAIFQSEDAAGDAGAAYDEVFKFYVNDIAEYKDQPIPATASDKLINLLGEAMRAGKMRDSYLDELVPMQMGLDVRPEYGSALELGGIPRIVLTRAEELKKAGDDAKVLYACRALWALGQRAFENNVRLENRQAGLSIMLSAGTEMYGVAGLQPGLGACLEIWAAALRKVQDAWNTKIQTIHNVRPQIGDLINIARHDQDGTFRIEATRWLGIAKFIPRHSGNARAIAAAIEAAKSDPDVRVVEAGKAAEAFTIDEFHRFR